MSIECKTCSSNAHVPKRPYPGSAGYDLWRAETEVLKPWSRELIRLDLFIWGDCRLFCLDKCACYFGSQWND